MSDIRSADLIALATGAMPGGPGAPRQVDLRRGVSHAYYAFFHDITDAVARQILSAQGVDVRRIYRRSLTHAALKRVSAGIASGDIGPLQEELARVAAPNASVRRVAQAFVDLQEERHRADYDHGDVFDARRLGDAIEVARTAMTTLSAERTTPPMAALLSLYALQSSWTR